jgi:hypothetical protein
MVDFKRLAKEEYAIVGGLLCSLFSALSPQKAIRFLNMQLAVSIGLYRMTNLSTAQKEVLAYPEFKHLKVDYTVYYQECVEFLLKGLLS